jgi:large subunit ribosomal protein L18
MPNTNYYHELAAKRRKRVRAKLHGTAERPRLTIFRSNKHTFLQAIDDVAGKTVASVHTKSIKKTGTKMETAAKAAQEIVKQLESKKISAVIIDRGSYRYHGRVKTIAETLRAGKVTV